MGIKKKKKSLSINCLAVLLGKKEKMKGSFLNTLLSFYSFHLKNCQLFIYLLISKSLIEHVFFLLTPIGNRVLV